MFARSERRHSTKPFRPPKPDGWSSASNGTTRLSTALVPHVRKAPFESLAGERNGSRRYFSANGVL